MTLVLSLVALLLGPFIYALGQARPNLRQVLDGFVFITIAGIVCVDIIPHAIEAGGFLAFAFLAVGLVFPVILERGFHDSVPQAHDFILLLAAFGLVLHAAIDGIALLPMGGDAPLLEHKLALGVILHRLPIGMAIWWSVRPNFGTGVAVGTFLLLGAATAVAYSLGRPVIEFAETASVAWFQAFVAGSLVHVVAFGISHDHSEALPARSQSAGWGYRIGILLGMFAIFTVPGLG